MRSGDKAPLIAVLEGCCEPCKKPDVADAVIIDGGMLVHLLKPHPSMATFKEYSDLIKNYVSNLANSLHSSRIDIVWDLYKENSIKASTRFSRGVGVRRQDLPTKGINTLLFMDFRYRFFLNLPLYSEIIIFITCYRCSP